MDEREKDRIREEFEASRSKGAEQYQAQQAQAPQQEGPAEGCVIKNVIGVVSGKGGVGKSLVTGILARELSRIKQFWGQCAWGELDYLLVDMPPGTSDVALTVFQSLPVEGVVIVSSPQDLVQMVVGKAVKMANMMDVPVLGLVENMAYVTCPHCAEKIFPYGPSRLQETADHFDLVALGQLPIDPALAAACDAGTFEQSVPDGLLPEAVQTVIQVAELTAALAGRDA